MGNLVHMYTCVTNFPAGKKKLKKLPLKKKIIKNNIPQKNILKMCHRTDFEADR